MLYIGSDFWDVCTSSIETLRPTFTLHNPTYHHPAFLNLPNTLPLLGLFAPISRAAISLSNPPRGTFPGTGGGPAPTALPLLAPNGLLFTSSSLGPNRFFIVTFMLGLLCPAFLRGSGAYELSGRWSDGSLTRPSAPMIGGADVAVEVWGSRGFMSGSMVMMEGIDGLL